ncbi:MAG: hypothetical protein ACYSVY_16635 [Planctomycetota bacterium]
MRILDANLDKKAAHVVGGGKALAQQEGADYLDTVHLLEAALIAYPEEAALWFRESGLDCSEATADFELPPGAFQTDGDRMPVSRELERVIRELESRSVVTLEALLTGILRTQSPRIKAWLAKRGGRPARRGGDQRGYRSSLDWLSAMVHLWGIRQVAAQACQNSVCCYGDGEPRLASTSSALSELSREFDKCAGRAAVSDRKHDPLAGLPIALNEVERLICEGVLVNELYPLDTYPFSGILVRALAEMAEPAGYPRQCGDVLAAVEHLVEKGVLVGDDEMSVGLDTRVRFTGCVLSQLLDDLAEATISAGEKYAIMLEIRNGMDWSTMP